MKLSAQPLLLVLFVHICSITAFGIKFGDIISSAVDVKKGIVSTAGNLIPTPEGFFQLGKNAIAGYPFEVGSSIINSVCSSALSAQAVLSKVNPDINKMNFQLITPCGNYSYPLTEANEMWTTLQFDETKKVVILATGWTNTVNESVPLWSLWKAYLCRNDVNFIIVDAGAFVDTLYTWSAFNTEEIGKYIAKGLQQLIDIVPLENIHLIGHSLGANIVGSAGREFSRLTGGLIPRITGLDPAKPCFNEGETLSGLSRGDADFIDIIHSNPGVLGKRDPIGDVDFYPGGLSPLPPGCVSITCAHSRAVHYFAETVYPGNELNMMAVRCNSLTDLQNDKCQGKASPMGFAVPRNIKGNYFLEINSNEPYGKNANSRSTRSNSQCHECPQSK